MKNLIIIFVFLNVIQLFSQKVLFPNDLSKKEIKNLNQLNLSLNTYSFDDINFNRDLKDLAYFNKKRKQNKVWAYVLSGIGTSLLAAAISTDAKNSNKEDLHAYSFLVYFSSAAYLGASIPFFVGNIKNKKRMKKKLIFVDNKLNRLK